MAFGITRCRCEAAALDDNIGITAYGSGKGFDRETPDIHAYDTPLIHMLPCPTALSSLPSMFQQKSHFPFFILQEIVIIAAGSL